MFRFFRKDREMLEQHEKDVRARAEARVEELYDSMSTAIALAHKIERSYEYAMSVGDEHAAYDAQQKYNRLVRAATVAQKIADRIECELIWDLPTTTERN